MVGFNITPIVRNLLLINIAVFLVQSVLDLGNRSIPNMFGLHSFTSEDFSAYQFLTHIFVHSNFSHILHNMLPLVFMGPLLERLLSSTRFLSLYMICGLGASLLYSGVNYVEYKMIEDRSEAFIANPSPAGLDLFILDEARWLYDASPDLGKFVHQDYPKNPENPAYIEEAKQIVLQCKAISKEGTNLVGASGAVFGLLMAFMLIFPNMEMMMLFIPVPIKAKYLIGAYALFEIYSLIQNRPDDNVAHFAHLAGMLFAFILIKLWGVKQVY